jgi:hypothetical protein
MLDEIIKKIILVCIQTKNLSLPPKIKNSNLERKQHPHEVFCKHHGLNYFGLRYWKGIACA